MLLLLPCLSSCVVASSTVTKKMAVNILVLHLEVSMEVAQSEVAQVEVDHVEALVDPVTELHKPLL